MCWEDVRKQDVREWVAWLLGRYSAAYASNQYRALQQFYNSDDSRRGDVDLWHREITVHGKGRKTRIVKISNDDARSLDRYLRVRARHAQAYRPQLWLGVNNRDPMTASGIYQVIVRRGRWLAPLLTPAAQPPRTPPRLPRGARRARP